MIFMEFLDDPLEGLQGEDPEVVRVGSYLYAKAPLPSEVVLKIIVERDTSGGEVEEIGLAQDVIDLEAGPCLFVFEYDEIGVGVESEAEQGDPVLAQKGFFPDFQPGTYSESVALYTSSILALCEEQVTDDVPDV
jgi:hypothetical protein